MKIFTAQPWISKRKEVMKRSELVEERRTAEEELHTKIQHVGSLHLIEFQKLGNKYKTRIVNEKLGLEKSMNEDFQIKGASINNKPETVLIKLKEEHAVDLKIWQIEN